MSCDVQGGFSDNLHYRRVDMQGGYAIMKDDYRRVGKSHDTSYMCAKGGLGMGAAWARRWLGEDMQGGQGRVGGVAWSDGVLQDLRCVTDIYLNVRHTS